MSLSIYSFCFIWLICGESFGFNIETRRFITHKGPSESKFGFSLAHHRDSKGIWVIVGAPEAETYVRGVTKGGAVYRCSVSVPNECQQIPFDTKGNHYDGTQYMDEKSHQWFGATVASRSGVVAACAPRYVWYSVKKNRREPIGGCFLLTQDRGPGRFKAYSPCMTNSWGYHKQGSCQAGFGVALSKGGGKLYVGAVGSWYWQGQVFYQNLLNMQEKRTTSEAPKEFDMSYMGFSLQTGDFDGDSEDDIAVGVPRGDELRGKVVLFDSQLNVLYNITGEQVGSYFGYSIAVLDADGDGRDDVAVGAPWYSEAHRPLYEHGMVAVFRQTKQRNFRSVTSLMGRESRAHFGLSVASLKDLNGDTYEDLAVGAPGGGPAGSGVVYIFMGSPEGIQPQPSQVLSIAGLSNEPVRTFGWSVSGGTDVDGNLFPDIAVGSHESNRVYIFRTRPVVHIQASLQFRSSSGVFDLESLDCSLLDGTSVSCYPLRRCLIYTGQGVPPNLDFVSSLQLDTSYTDHTSRLFFLKNEGKYIDNRTISLKKDIESCDSFHIYAAPLVPDKLTPLVAELWTSVKETEDISDPLVIEPILSPQGGRGGSLTSDTIYFQNNCGSDNICIPDLSLTLTTNLTEYVVGSLTTLPLEVRIRNAGEDAYKSRLLVFSPPGIHFSKFSVTFNSAIDHVTPFCTRVLAPKSLDQDEDDEQQEQLATLEYVVCEVGNPMPSNSAVGISLFFQPSSNATLDRALEFRALVNSTNEEMNATLEDNEVALSLPAEMRSDISVRGISWPDGEFSYNSSLFGTSLLGAGQSVTHEREIGPQVTHVYDVLNRGPSDLPDVEIFLLWPTRTLVGEPLLYLLETPEVSSAGYIRCDVPEDVNYLNLYLETPEELPLTATSLRSRQTRDTDSSIYPQETRSLNSILSCGSTNCTIMKCNKDALKNNENFIVKIRSRLWVDTIDQMGLSNVRISSRLVVRSSSTGAMWSEGVTSTVQTGVLTPTPSMSWLIWAGAIAVGLLVLAILILLLWMVGFFKRRRPHDEAQNQLLHRLPPDQNGKIT